MIETAVTVMSDTLTEMRQRVKMRVRFIYHPTLYLNGMAENKEEFVIRFQDDRDTLKEWVQRNAGDGTVVTVEVREWDVPDVGETITYTFGEGEFISPDSDAEPGDTISGEITHIGQDIEVKVGPDEYEYINVNEYLE